MNDPAPASALTVRYVGGPTAVLETAGIRLLTDPTFDPPGDHPFGGARLVKTAGPALTPAQVGPVDVVLLSHDQHPDNLDRAGRACLAGASLVLTTASARRRLEGNGNVRALGNWEDFDLPRPGGGTLRITGVPARHGPPGAEHLVGEVTGFVLTGDGLPTVYVSGDNASPEATRAVARRFGMFDAALLFCGGARIPLLGDARLTLTSEQAARATRILGARTVVPLHFEHWDHVVQGADTLVEAFREAGLAERLRVPEPGRRITVRADADG